jgi:hypothetical protein
MEQLKPQALLSDAPFVLKPNLGQIAEWARHLSRDHGNAR